MLAVPAHMLNPAVQTSLRGDSYPAWCILSSAWQDCSGSQVNPLTSLC